MHYSSTSGEQSYNDKIDRSTSSSESSLSPSESLPSWDTPADPMAMGSLAVVFIGRASNSLINS